MKSLVVLAVYFINVESAPPDYCLLPLNRSDCNIKPTPVFYYYKSGSRCEIGYWRGCPTYNKFTNHFDCVDTCIFRFSMHDIYNVTSITTTEEPIALEDELIDLPIEDLGELNEIIEEVGDDIKKLKAPEEPLEPETEAPTTEHEPEHEPEPEPDEHEPEPEHETEPEHHDTEEKHETEEETETEATTTTDDSGIVDEVELP